MNKRRRSVEENTNIDSDNPGEDNSPKSSFSSEKFESTLRVSNAPNAEKPDEKVESEHENVAKKAAFRRRRVLKMSATPTHDHLGRFV